MCEQGGGGVVACLLAVDSVTRIHRGGKATLNAPFDLHSFDLTSANRLVIKPRLCRSRNRLGTSGFLD